MLRGLFSPWGERAPLSSCGAWASPCGGFSCFGAQALGQWASTVAAHKLSTYSSRALKCSDFSNCGLWALECRVSSCGAQV